MKKNRLMVFFGIFAVVLVAGIVLSLPPVWSRVSFHADQLYSDIKYKLFPPEKVVFIPGQITPNAVATSVQATLNASAVTPTPIITVPTPTELPTSTPFPLPVSVYLEGVRPEQQRYNNCGPATLSMNLSFWKWTGDPAIKVEIPQDHIAPILKPYKEDKNVMPYEMKNYVDEYTPLNAIVRMGGDLQTLKTLVNAGFPVLVEKGFEGTNFEGWMGHYNLVIGYDDNKQVFTTQDSYLLINKTNWQTSRGFEVKYADMLNNWRAFNNIFLVVYPPEKGNDVLNALGSLADEKNAYQIAYERAQQEIATLTDPRDQYFAWFNAGTSLVYLQDYTGASTAYDKAFSIIYPTIAEKSRPWRMMWYQTGPYFAYYYTARYADVIKLADTTLSAMSKPVLEESFYWRGMAELSLGNQDAAIKDFEEGLKYHVGFIPIVDQLNLLGITP
jgi:hypothetical protein